MYAPRPLTVTELADPLLIPDVYERSTETWIDDFPEAIDDSYIRTGLVDCCESFFRVQDVEEPNLPGTRTVSVAHSTVQNLLHRKLPRQQEFDTSALTKSYENSLLAQRCIQYLDCDDTWNTVPPESFESDRRPFVFYASTSWFVHTILV